MKKPFGESHIIALCCIVLSITLPSCAEKIYLQDALKSPDAANVNVQNDIQVESHYSGDAFEYIIFELDVFNNSASDISISRRDVRLEIQPESGPSFELNPLDKDKLISELEQRHRSVKAERKTNNIVNAVFLGLNVVAAAASPGLNAADVVWIGTDSAIYMADENRAYKLIEGSLEEQIGYVNEWVLDDALIPAGTDNSWDLLFMRRLADGPAKLIVEIESLEFIQEFDLFIREERVR